MGTTLSEMIWRRSLLEELGIKRFNIVVLFCDSKTALHIASNPIFHKRMKHIEIDCNYIRGKIQEGVVLTWHVNSSSTVSEPIYKGIWNATTLCFARTAWSEGHLLCEVFFPLMVLV